MEERGGTEKRRAEHEKKGFSGRQQKGMRKVSRNLNKEGRSMNKIKL